MTDCGPDPETRLGQIRAAIAGGVDWVQLRERRAEPRDLLAFADRVRDLCDADPERGVRLLINRRLDIALVCGADGVHLGFDGPPAAAARASWALAKGDGSGHEPLVGLSTHSVEEARWAHRSGADYVHLAPIYTPLSKHSERVPLGLAALVALARSEDAGCRVIAQGGIEVKRVDAVVGAGAGGIAVTGAILAAADCEAAARELRKALERCELRP